MTSKSGFTKLSISEFEQWIANLKVAKTILYIQQHHTWNPSYISFKNDNHFELQLAMKNYHVNNNGWMDIGQHFTTFPDGSILTGRSLEQTPACIFGFNANAICIENLGNFDLGKDTMTAAHKETIVRITAALCKKFNIPVNSNKIVYHHWFNLSTGERNNGTKNNKTCPGTNFFGGNKVADCEKNFLPLVTNILGTVAPSTNVSVLKYVYVTADTLNIREEANIQSNKVKGMDAATLGAILRVYEIKNGWYKISSSTNNWVNASYTKDVKRYTINTNALNVRSGPGTNYPKVGSLSKNQEVFVIEEENNWFKISADNKWVKKEFLTIMR
ncbi:SH3 domain-containing protein [Pedobacter alluvionis]|uniref:Amidase n=1 Tax=Pedobacter alluvionis TaxID=475253 RepID=A0A497YKC5_9SPHI|nr:SH3 domain-containing protein [Pedobacter alluvionis]RLJ80510.1 SH3 domain-containing protein [Pedobacter alluvionis]TFB31780.1 amidase [Pedobacter alluvionis]